MTDTLELLRPFGSLAVLSSVNRSFYALFNTLIRVAATRDCPTDLFCELVSENGESLLNIDFNPTLTEVEFRALVQTAEPAVFARGNLIYARSNTEGLEAQLDVIGVSDPRSLHLPLNVIAFKDQVQPKKGRLVIQGIDRSDIIQWSQLDEIQIVTQTALGNRIPPRVTLYLVHVERPKKIEGKWEWEAYRLETSGAKSASVKIPFRSEIALPTSNITLTGAVGIVFGLNARRIRVCDVNRTFPELESVFSGIVTACLKRMVPVRLQTKFGYYFELDYLKELKVGPLGEFPEVIIQETKKELPKFFDKFADWPELKETITQASLMAVAEEAETLKLRKARARFSRAVYLFRNGKEHRLCREPENEQDVVLLTSMLAQYGVFELFEFIDYETHAGIDALVRLQLTKKRPIDEDAIVEFKRKLEDFLNELHPLSLINLIIAWDVTEERFTNSPYLLSKPIEGRKWLRRLEARTDGSAADVVLLRHIENLRLR